MIIYHLTLVTFTQFPNSPFEKSTYFFIGIIFTLL